MRCIVQEAEDVWFVIRGLGMRIHVSEFRVQDSRFGFANWESVLGFRFVQYLDFRVRV